jgi:hypothetical protein
MGVFVRFAEEVLALQTLDGSKLPGSDPCKSKSDGLDLGRYEKRHSNLSAHVSPAFRVKEGDRVIVGQCRPLSKTVRFNVLRVIPAGASDGGKKKSFAAI